MNPSSALFSSCATRMVIGSVLFVPFRKISWSSIRCSSIFVSGQSSVRNLAKSQLSVLCAGRILEVETILATALFPLPILSGRQNPLQYSYCGRYLLEGRIAKPEHQTVRKAGSKVWGVLYEVPDYLIHRETARARKRKSFDQIEGEGTNYKRQTIHVRRQNGDIATALTYTVNDPKRGLKTNIDYVGHIVRGLRDHGVPDTSRRSRQLRWQTTLASQERCTISNTSRTRWSHTSTRTHIHSPTPAVSSGNSTLT